MPQAQPTSDPLVLFLHIPKTGGTTLLRILTHAYGAQRSIRVNKHGSKGNFEAVGQILRERPYDYDMISAHMAKFGVHEYLNGQRRYWYVGALRHPGQRALSRYYHILRTPHHHRYTRFTKEISNPRDAIPALGRNLQTRVMAGRDPEDTRRLTKADLEQAKHNLREHFAAPFIIERYADSLVLLKRALGWTRVYTTVPRNVAPNRPRHDDDALLKLAREVNALDMQLYAYANDLLTQRIRQAGPGYKMERHTFVVKQVLRRQIIIPARRWIKEATSSAPPHEDADRDDDD